jgi:hypothetical protein
MHSSEHYRRPAAAVMMAAVLSLACMPGVAPADDYLSILEAEAADTANTANPAGQPRTKPVQPGKYMTPGLGFDAFSEELRSRYAGTYLLYMKLSPSERQLAWKSYRQDNKLASVRKRIVSLMASS